MILLLSSIALSLLACTFVVWRRAGHRGYSEERIVDLLLIMGFSGFLFAHIAAVLSSPPVEVLNLLIFWKPPYFFYGGVLGAFFALYLVCRRFGWSLAEVGDVIVPGVLVLFVGLNLTCAINQCGRDTALMEAVLYTLFSFLYFYREQLLNSVSVRSGIYFFGLLFLIPLFDAIFSVFDGGRLAQESMLAVAVGVIAVVGFVQRLRSGLLSTSAHIDRRVDLGGRRRQRKSTMKKLPSLNPQLPKHFMKKMRRRLRQREQEIRDEIKTLEQEDPFKETDRTSDNAEMISEATEQGSHEIIAAQMRYLRSSMKSIKNALSRMRTGTYGVSEESGKPISPERLEVNPTATRTVEEEEQAESEAGDTLPPMERIS